MMACFLCHEEGNNQVVFILECGDPVHGQCAIQQHVILETTTTGVDCQTHGVQNIVKELPERGDHSLELDINLLFARLKRQYKEICFLEPSIFKPSLDEDQQVMQILDALKQPKVYTKLVFQCRKPNGHIRLFLWNTVIHSLWRLIH